MMPAVCSVEVNHVVRKHVGLFCLEPKRSSGSNNHHLSKTIMVEYPTRTAGTGPRQPGQATKRKDQQIVHENKAGESQLPP